MARRKRRVKTACGNYTLVPDNSDRYADNFDVQSVTGAEIGRIEEDAGGVFSVINTRGKWVDEAKSVNAAAKALCRYNRGR